MKTETPRTDAVTCGKGYGIPGNTVSADFARELELELALANSIIKCGIAENKRIKEILAMQHFRKDKRARRDA